MRNLDGVAGLKCSDHLDDPDRQQARAAVAKRLRGTRVDQHAPTGGLGVLEPQLEARVAPLAGREAGADRFAGRGRRERTGLEPARDHRRDPGGSRHLGGDDLGVHSAGAEGRGVGADLKALEGLRI